MARRHHVCLVSRVLAVERYSPKLVYKGAVLENFKCCVRFKVFVEKLTEIVVRSFHLTVLQACSRSAV